MTARGDGPRDAAKALIKALLKAEGRTYAEEAGIRLRDTPQPLYELLVLSVLLSAPIRGGAAVGAARELFGAGMRDARRMADATWQERVDALGRGGYRRYDESTATRLGDGAQLVQRDYGGDLRRMRDEAGGDAEALGRSLQKVPGLGPTGAAIFLREVQRVWPETGPYFGDKALDGARRLGLPDDPDELMRLAGRTEPAVLSAALVRASLEKRTADDL
ncbi:endonuclease [Streptomyces sp. NPDC050703]|uniref:endonuclease n=1 Tax=Streptomyces sp. NPDC050703 TaxID=3157218 RepID=UPI00343E7237